MADKTAVLRTVIRRIVEGETTVVETSGIQNDMAEFHLRFFLFLGAGMRGLRVCAWVRRED